MRGLFGIVIAAAVIYIAAAAPRCPPQNGPDVTLLANPDKCNTYYLCNAGHPFLMSCPDGLYFNPDLRVCDWTIREEKDGCKIPSVSTTTEGDFPTTTATEPPLNSTTEPPPNSTTETPPNSTTEPPPQSKV